MKIGEYEISFSGILTGIYLFSVPVFSYSVELGLSAIPQAIALLLIVFTLYQVLNRKSFNLNPVAFLYLAYCFWGIIVSFFCEYHVNTSVLFTFLKIGVITVAASMVIYRPRDFSIAILLFFLSVFVTVMLNFNDIIAMRGLEEAEDEMRLAGTFANANTAALYGLLIIWAGLMLIMERRRSVIIRILLIIGILLAGALVIYSGSRKGMLGFILLFVTFSVLAYRKYGLSRGSRIFIVLLSLASLALVIYLLATSPFISRVVLVFSGEESSFNVRSYLIKEAIRVWNRDPLTFMIGVGPGNFYHYNYLKLYSHTTFTETLVTTGLVGFLIYFSAVGVNLRMYYVTIRDQEGPDKIHLKAMAVFLLLNLLFSAFAVMIDDRLSWPIMAMMYSYGLMFRRNQALWSQQRFMY